MTAAENTVDPTPLGSNNPQNSPRAKAVFLTHQSLPLGSVWEGRAEGW
jgi:hypothetical protein